jgi:inositol hexakisphosphate/diphosphoinositol-pentakisphosphate kinase
MAKKAKSGPMMEILNRISAFSHDGQPEFQILVFDEETILKRPIDEWPLCEALISFFSTGFPLRKAQAYASLRRPHVFNNLEKQELLFDRRRVYAILESVGVPVPKHVCFDASDKSTTVEDSDEWLQINGVRINKPLVEKPISGEDHNIYIYYPRSQGGGSKRLFRKVGDRSAQFYPDEHKTRIGDGNSYIYEELLQTEGTDVKVYAVGPEYAHAEARKSPVVDGRVMRNVRGMEMRYPVILSNVEKTIARKVVSAFGQFVCGFDILRSNVERRMSNRTFVTSTAGRA